MKPEDFIRESNKIEDILRDPTRAELVEYDRFMGLRKLTLQDVEQFVSVYQPDADLRVHIGMDVMVGNYFPPRGCITIKTRLIDILNEANVGRGDPNRAYLLHLRYEKLHPFMDGNGRSGRMIWLWMMREAKLGFLHTWYYQTLKGI